MNTETYSPNLDYIMSNFGLMGTTIKSHHPNSSLTGSELKRVLIEAQQSASLTHRMKLIGFSRFKDHQTGSNLVCMDGRLGVGQTQHLFDLLMGSSLPSGNSDGFCSFPIRMGENEKSGFFNDHVCDDTMMMFKLIKTKLSDGISSKYGCLRNNSESMSLRESSKYLGQDKFNSVTKPHEAELKFYEGVIEMVDNFHFLYMVFPFTFVNERAFAHSDPHSKLKKHIKLDQEHQRLEGLKDRHYSALGIASIMDDLIKTKSGDKNG